MIDGASISAGSAQDRDLQLISEGKILQIDLLDLCTNL